VTTTRDHTPPKAWFLLRPEGATGCAEARILKGLGSSDTLFTQAMMGKWGDEAEHDFQASESTFPQHGNPTITA